MNPKKPSKLAGTRIWLASTEVDMSDPDTINWLKSNKISKVFCLFPVTSKQFTELGKDQQLSYQSLQSLYGARKINPNFVTELAKAGILVSSLQRSPRSLRGYESFVKEALQTPGSFVIQCFGGKHASAAYAVYYLAKITPVDLQEIRSIFYHSGRASDLPIIEKMLEESGTSLTLLVKRKQAFYKRIKVNVGKSMEKSFPKHPKKGRRK